MPKCQETEFTVQSIDGIPLDALVQTPDSPLGSIVLAHGFSVDYHEEGAFDRLAQGLVDAGFAVLRFSFEVMAGAAAPK